jgi:prepilin-type processing-associated H-X9-DG protein
MEILVTVSIILVLSVLGYAVYLGVQRKANRVAAAQKMTQLGTGLSRYISDNDGLLPKEDTDTGENSWEAASRPESADAWFNALPSRAGGKGTGDYQKDGNTAAFYAKDSLLSLQGADYPKSKLRSPIYAFAFNTKLHRKDPKSGEKPRVKIGSIKVPARTVALLEQGIKNEKRPMKGMKSYDGDDSKASGKQFVARWGEVGNIMFLDGHVESVKAAQILENNAGLRLRWTAGDTSGILWCPEPTEDPN